MTDISESTVTITLDLTAFRAALDNAAETLKTARLEGHFEPVTPGVDGPKTPFQIGGRD